MQWRGKISLPSVGEEEAKKKEHRSRKIFRTDISTSRINIHGPFWSIIWTLDMYKHTACMTQIIPKTIYWSNFNKNWVSCTSPTHLLLKFMNFGIKYNRTRNIEQIARFLTSLQDWRTTVHTLYTYTVFGLINNNYNGQERPKRVKRDHGKRNCFASRNKWLLNES